MYCLWIVVDVCQILQNVKEVFDYYYKLFINLYYIVSINEIIFVYYKDLLYSVYR